MNEDPESTAEAVNEDPTLAEGRERGMAIRTDVRKRNENGMMRTEDAMEEKAKGISEAAVKRYWRQREEERKAPRG